MTKAAASCRSIVMYDTCSMHPPPVLYPGRIVLYNTALPCCLTD